MYSIRLAANYNEKGHKHLRVKILKHTECNDLPSCLVLQYNALKYVP
jgi:hypothetical protein